MERRIYRVRFLWDMCSAMGGEITWVDLYGWLADLIQLASYVRTQDFVCDMDGIQTNNRQTGQIRSERTERYYFNGTLLPLPLPLLPVLLSRIRLFSCQSSKFDRLSI